MQTPVKRQAKRQTVKLTTWVKPGVKAELQRIAKAEGLSLSRTGAAALEEWLAGRLQVQYAGILQPIIEQAIAKQMRAYSSRIAVLLVRSMFTSEQTRALTTNILTRQPGQHRHRGVPGRCRSASPRSLPARLRWHHPW